MEQHLYDIKNPRDAPGNYPFNIFGSNIKVHKELDKRLSVVKFNIYRTEIHHVRSVMTVMAFLG